jgi:TolA-binding protein
MATTPSVTSLLLQQEDLQTQIDSVDSKIAALHQTMKECESQINAYEQDRKRLDYLTWELQKALAKAVCPTNQVLLRFSSTLNALRNPDHPNGGALAIDQRWADLGFTQSSSEG